MEPYTTLRPLGSDNPRDLWKWLAAYEEKTGGRVLAIAHNGNLSNGIMFPIVESFTGKRVDREYAETRAKWEPLYEATQIKGDGETHPFLSPNDEFADYETWDQGNLDLSVLKKDKMLQYEYARSALAIGLQLEQKLGVNPYKFGMIGSTDSHTGLATAEENNFFGKHSGSEPGPERWAHPMAETPGGRFEGWSMVASGYAAVWATENTREAIFDAMMRKETYATTGPRMIVRFFGGWDFTEADAQSRLPATVGYKEGVPMGGTLLSAPSGKSPTFPWPRSRTRSRAISIASRSSRCGWMPGATARRRSTTSSGRVIARPVATASCRRSAPRLTSRTPRGRTPSGHPCSSPYGPIPISIRTGPLRTTRASSRSPRRVGLPTTPRTTGSGCPRKSR